MPFTLKTIITPLPPRSHLNLPTSYKLLSAHTTTHYLVLTLLIDLTQRLDRHTIIQAREGQSLPPSTTYLCPYDDGIETTHLFLTP